MELESVSKVPAAMITPILRYRNPSQASEWLKAAFGFEIATTVADTDEQQAHIVLGYGNQVVVLYPAKGSLLDDFMSQPEDNGGMSTQLCYIAVDDIDRHFRTASAAGAKIEVPLRGEAEDATGRFYMCRDPEGFLWSFGTVTHVGPRTIADGSIAGDKTPAAKTVPANTERQSHDTRQASPAIQLDNKSGQVQEAIPDHDNSRGIGLTVVVGFGALIIGLASLVGAFFIFSNDYEAKLRLKAAVATARLDGKNQVRLVRNRMRAELATVNSQLETVKAREKSAKKALAEVHRLLAIETEALKRTRSGADRVSTDLHALNKKLKAAAAAARQAKARQEAQNKTILALRGSSAKLAEKIKRLESALSKSSARLREQQVLAKNQSSLAVKRGNELRRAKAKATALGELVEASEQKVSALQTARNSANARIKGLLAKIKEVEATVLRHAQLQGAGSKRIKLVSADRIEKILSDDGAIAALSRLQVVVTAAARKIESLDNQLKAQREKAKTPKKPKPVAAEPKPSVVQAKPVPGGPFQTTCGRSVWKGVLQKYKRPQKTMRGLTVRLCSANKNSAEPAKCLRAVMSGQLSWGPSKKWPLGNAVNLCSGSANASATLRCFRRQLAALKSWRRALEQCTAY